MQTEAFQRKKQATPLNLNEPHYLILAGEHSSDAYGHLLVDVLKKQQKQLHISAMGGAKLASVSDVFLGNIVQENTFGIVEKWWHRRSFNRLFSALEATLKTQKIDRVIIIDCAEHYKSFSALLLKYNVPITTFITPHDWMVGLNIQRVSKASESIITIFPKEYALYQEQHPDVHYVGHPLIKTLSYSLPPETPVTKYTDKINLILCPGSRTQEVRHLLPVMLQVCQKLSLESPVHATVYAQHPDIASLIDNFSSSASLSIDSTAIFDPALIQDTHMVLTCSGTMTLEVMLWKRPMVVLCHFSTLSYIIAKYLLRIPEPKIALPNVLSNTSLVPEFFRHLYPDKILAHVKRLLDPVNASQQITGYTPLLKLLFKKQNPISEAATIILNENSSSSV